MESEWKRRKWVHSFNDIRKSTRAHRFHWTDLGYVEHNVSVKYWSIILINCGETVGGYNRIYYYFED